MRLRPPRRRRALKALVFRPFSVDQRPKTRRQIGDGKTSRGCSCNGGSYIGYSVGLQGLKPLLVKDYECRSLRPRIRDWNVLPEQVTWFSFSLPPINVEKSDDEWDTNGLSWDTSSIFTSVACTEEIDDRFNTQAYRLAFSTITSANSCTERKLLMNETYTWIIRWRVLYFHPCVNKYEEKLMIYITCRQRGRWHTYALFIPVGKYGENVK